MALARAGRAHQQQVGNLTIINPFAAALSDLNLEPRE